jgi:spoIIIJ-associated protein
VDSESWNAGDGDDLGSSGGSSPQAQSGAPQDLDSTASYLQELLEKVADGIGVDAEVAIRADGDTLVGEYIGDDLGPLIGHHGQTIDAIQHLAYRIMFRRTEQSVRVVVDAAGYRERRAVALKATADQAAEAAVHDGRPVALEAMNALERRVVHEHLKNRHDVETYSEGQEPDRRLVVAPVVH